MVVRSQHRRRLLLVVQWHVFATRHRTTPLAEVYHARSRVLPGCAISSTTLR
ncbi:MAG: hypothetical protein OJF49_001337 [Ktedonobacterales bacterium]|nr:MAG: hypothetical protein OJF49_001337 [Ktedonobacterales bacterium]